MFILKLGAEALNIKNNDVTIETSNSSDYTSTSSSPNSFDMSQNLLESLLSKRNTIYENSHLKLLKTDDEVVNCFRPRFNSVKSEKDSAFLKLLNEPEHDDNMRPRSETAPTRKLAFQNITRKRQIQQQIDTNCIDNKRLKPSKNQCTSSILFQHLSKITPNDNVDNDSTLVNDETLITNTDIKEFRKNINNILKKVMMIIKSYTNYMKVNDDLKLEFISKLWYRLLVLLLIQMDNNESKDILNKLYLVNKYSGINNDNKDSLNHQYIILINKIQDIIESFQHIKDSNTMFNLVIFWLLGKYGYPDLFQLSEQTILLQLFTSTFMSSSSSSSISTPATITALISSLHDLETDSLQLQSLFCSHLVTNDLESSIGEFLIQWT